MPRSFPAPASWVVRTPRQRIALRLPVRALLVGLLLLLLTALIIVVSLLLGSFEISPSDVWQILRHPQSQHGTIIWEFRLPRILAAALVGAMLALSGAALQNVTGNGLADPSLVGISQGAGLAVVALVILRPDLDLNLRPLVAFAGSLAVAGLIQLLSWRRQNDGSIRFILMGIGIAAFISALTSMLMTYGQVDRAMSALTWLSGSIHNVGWPEVRMLTFWFVVLLPLLLSLSRSMAALQMGPVAAIGLGVAAGRVRLVLIALAVALAAIATAAVGPLGFIGLLAPHAARRIAHCGCGLHLLLTAAVGALLVTLADLIGRVAFAPIQIPAGLVTAIIGVPIFILLLQRSQKRSAL